MTLIELFTAELQREAPRTRGALAAVPSGRDDWKPHARSMPLLRLAGLVASMPSWVGLIIEQDELNLTPPPGQGQFQPPSIDTLGSTHDKLVAQALESLARTNDNFLYTTNWKLIAGGQVVMEQPRHIVLRDTLNHLAHHRGQLTVYLRLLGVPLPPVYGPTADENPLA
jgi:uncharacterized damage-inducible protein DinB